MVKHNKKVSDNKKMEGVMFFLFFLFSCRYSKNIRRLSCFLKLLK
jgi:hypothetical protein